MKALLIFVLGFMAGLMLDQAQSTAIEQGAYDKALAIIAQALPTRPECISSIRSELH